MRRTLLLLSWFVSGAAFAAYPEKPIRFVIPSAAGGSPDILMRVMTQQLSAQMGVAFVVENKPGASFTLGTMDVVKAAPDGYTLGYGNIVSLAINRSLLAKVPYEVEKDLTLAGEVHLMFDNISSIGARARAGRVRGIAVSGPRRSPLFPDLPTLHEAGVKGYETVAWGGVIAPANLPRDLVTRLHAEIRKALASPFVLERFKQLDTEPDGGMPEEFLALVRSEAPKWADVVRRSGAKVD